jgi:hypothetical protein
VRRAALVVTAGLPIGLLVASVLLLAALSFTPGIFLIGASR